MFFSRTFSRMPETGITDNMYGITVGEKGGGEGGCEFEPPNTQSGFNVIFQCLPT